MAIVAARAEIPETSIRYPGWRVVLACFVMAMLIWGFGFYGHGFYLAELKRLHGWPSSLIAGATTAYYLSSALLVIFISDAIRRFGMAACVLVGALSLAGSVAALPFVTEPWHVVAAYLVMSLAWATMSLGAINNILGLWFERKRGLAISLALNGASFSGVVIVPGLVFLAAAVGFRVAMLAGAGFILALMLPLVATVLRRDLPYATDKPDVAEATNGAPLQARPIAWTRASALRSLAFWSASAPFALAITSQAGFLVHQIAFLEGSIGRYQAGIAVALTTAMAIVGRLLLGAVADRLDQRLASAVSVTSQAAALAVMTQATDATVLLAACAAYGFSVGNVITLPSLVIQREFDAAAFGMLIGLSTGISQFTYAFGPGLLGLVRDATGGYGAALGVCIALNLVAAAIVLRRPRSLSSRNFA
jgi:MFS family permease